ncbi:hypothetical protein NBRC10512_003857 [Rhodotorula toruloides]|nr:uncharacterized protein RHTO_01179 [Rhodotorula toruloides NP11]EMS21964.1 hypothetical protein RHTO_01179 [Rhodotorula toruloides NP11]
MPTTHLCTPYGPTDHPPTPARWKKRPRLALQSTSAVNSLAAPGRGAEDVKGKGKAAEGAVLAAKGARPWKEADALLQQSFSIYRTTGLHSLPLASSSTSSSQFSSFAQSLQAYISQQLALEATGSSRTGRRIKRTKRVEAGYVDVPLLGKDGARPVMVEIELGEGSDNCPSTSKSRSARTQRTSTFVFLPHATSNSFSLLLVKSAVPAAVHLFSTFLSTRFDALIHPFRIPPPRMLDLLQALVLHRDRSLAETASTDETALATNMTFAFPPNIAREGLSTMTLTLPPAILPSLTADSSSSFVSGLTAHMIQTTSIPLSSLFLVRLGAGRGTFIHSGQVPPGGPAPFLRPASPFDPLPSTDSPSILPASPYSTDAEGKIHFDSRRWKLQREGQKQVCMRDVYGASAGFDFALKNKALVKTPEGAHVSISESFKLDYDTTRVFYIEACLPYGIKGWLGQNGGGFGFDLGSRDNTTVKITEDRKVQSSSAKSPSAAQAEKKAEDSANLIL